MKNHTLCLLFIVFVGTTLTLQQVQYGFLDARITKQQGDIIRFQRRFEQTAAVQLRGKVDSVPQTLYSKEEQKHKKR